MKIPTHCIFFATWIAFTSAPADEVSSPPQAEIERLQLNPFYQKYISASGFPVVSSAKVNDHALREAAYLIEKMIGHRPDILDAITAAGVRFSIMAPNEFTTDIPEHSKLKPKEYWDKRARGLGATKNAPSVSCGEENLLEYPGDPYARENILIHEFAHVIHEIGLKAVDPTFQKRLEQAFNRASLQGLWRSKYAGTNPSEYWAEGVQSWFDCNRENDHDHNHVNTRQELKEHDKELVALVEEVFGDSDWRYVKPSLRKKPSLHLAEYDRSKAPVFAWPEDLVAAYEALDRGDNLAKAKAIPLNKIAESGPSPGSKKQVSLRFDNRTKSRVKIHWIDFQGKRSPRGWIDPERKATHKTFAGHLWVITDEKGKALAFTKTPDENAMFVIE